MVAANHQLVPFNKDEVGGCPPEHTPAVQYPAGADDIQLAREWIYEHISADKFGNGAVNKVVLFGHSSGGAHIAMNLYGSSSEAVFPPVAGVIYLSVPFWYDRTRPIRQKILQRYYGSDAEDVWGVSLIEPFVENSVSL